MTGATMKKINDKELKQINKLRKRLGMPLLKSKKPKDYKDYLKEDKGHINNIKKEL